MEALSPPGFLFQFLSLPYLLIFTISMSWFALYPSDACEPFYCGEYQYEYPFGMKQSGCGDPALQLECDTEWHMPLLDINGRSYYVLWPLRTWFPFHPWYQSHQIRIVDKDLHLDGCNLSSINHSAQFWSTSTNSSDQFHIAEGYGIIALGTECGKNITGQIAIKLGCRGDWYYFRDSTLAPKYCKSQVQLPVNTSQISSDPEKILESLEKGFEIQWNFSKGCADCESKNRSCFYDTNTSAIQCKGKPSNIKPSNIAVPLGCAFGGVVVAAVVVLLFIFYLKRRKSSSLSSKNLQLYVVGKSRNSRSLLKVEEFLQDYSHQTPTRYSYSQLKKITNNFANKLGEGGFGVVYKGKLQNGNLVAVKILDQSRQCEIQFMNEIATIGRTHHFNLVRLIGYCFEEFRSALVYEYMVNGSLEKFIFVEKDKPHMLSWEQLYSIALGAARGIAYLHQDCDRRIVHFDIKPHNILLDADFTAKVSDFGLAKLCGRGDDHVSITDTRGTPGYVAPELWSRNLGPVTDKSDVYSFGMLLLEIVGGRKNIDVQVSRPSEVYFPEWAFRLWERGELGTWLRGKREMESEEEEKARRLTKIGLWCIQYSSTHRPSMNRVVQMLEGNGDDVSNPPLPFNSALPGAQLLSSADESSY